MKTSSVQTLRDASAVLRYHTCRTARTQDLAQHQWGVAMLVLVVEPKAGPNLVRAALTHDLAEYTTGDLPYPVKMDNPELKDELGEIEERFEAEHGLAFHLTEYEMRVLKWCDMAELCLWCLEDIRLGNKNANVPFNNGMAALSSMGCPSPAARQILKTLLGGV